MTLAALCLVYYLPKHQVLVVDSLLAWPITDSFMHPGRYGSEDLIVRAGVAGNFLLYKLMAHLPMLQDNLPLRDVLIYLPIFFLYLLAWYDLFFTLSGERRLSFVALLFLLFSDAKLGLNWSNSPIPFFLSVTSVQFLQVFSFSLFLKRHRKTALVIVALTGYLHPATALVFGSVFSSLIVMDALRGRNLRLLVPVLLFGMLFLPNVALIVLNSQGALQITEQFFRIYSLFQYHVYLADHLREGYAYTLALIALLAVCLRKKIITTRHDGYLLAFFAFSIGYCALWLINVYTLRNLQILQTYFIMRIFYLVKPLVILLSLMLYQRLSEDRPLWEQSALLLLPACFLWLSPTTSLIIVIGVTCYLKKPAAGFAVLLILLPALGCLLTYAGLDVMQVYSYLVENPRSNEFIAVDLVLLAAYLLLVLPWAGSMPDEAGGAAGNAAARTLVLLVLLLTVGAKLPVKIYRTVGLLADRQGAGISLSRATGYGLDRRNPDYHKLITWAGLSHGRTYVVPPYDLEFASFRFLSGNGVYAHQYDINQLTYSPDYYLPAYERLLVLGLMPESGEKYRWKWGYDRLPLQTIARLKADFIVFRRPAPPEVLASGVRPVFQNAPYSVYALGALRVAAESRRTVSAGLSEKMSPPGAP